MNNTFQPNAVPDRIDILMSIDPVQTKAFLIGLQSGYNLAKAAPADREEKKN